MNKKLTAEIESTPERFQPFSLEGIDPVTVDDPAHGMFIEEKRVLSFSR